MTPLDEAIHAISQLCQRDDLGRALFDDLHSLLDRLYIVRAGVRQGGGIADSDPIHAWGKP